MLAGESRCTRRDWRAIVAACPRKAFSSFERDTPPAECDFERGGATQSRERFVDLYANHRNGGNAYGKCVSPKAHG